MIAKDFKKEYEQCVKGWEGRAKKALIGLQIVGVRYLREDEVAGLGLSHTVLVLELSNGSLLFPSTDDEGNDGGAMFGQTKDGGDMTFPVIRNYG